MTLLLSALIACIPAASTVQMTGTVYDAPNASGSVVGGVDVKALDSSGAVVDEQTSDDGGAFAVTITAGDGFFIETDGPAGQGYVPTAFSGTAGLVDFDAGVGFPWIASPDWFSTLQSQWVGCPGADTAGTAGSGVALTGEIRLYMNISDINEMPISTGATVRVTPAIGSEVEACYHDDSGVYAGAATGTGADGQFAVFGAAAGGLAVSVEYTDTSETRRVVIYQYTAEDGGLVPILPTFVYDGGS